MTLKKQLTQDLEAAGFTVEDYVFPDGSDSFLNISKNGYSVEFHFDSKDKTLLGIELWDSTMGKAVRVI